MQSEVAPSVDLTLNKGVLRDHNAPEVIKASGSDTGIVLYTLACPPCNINKLLGSGSRTTGAYTNVNHFRCSPQFKSRLLPDWRLCQHAYLEEGL